MKTSGNRGRNVSNLEGLGGGRGENRNAELQTGERPPYNTNNQRT